MSYIECRIQLKPFIPFNEILVAKLGEVGFESFTEDGLNEILSAYIQEEEYSEKEVLAVCESFKELIHYSIESSVIKKENWNKKWEENFDPVKVSNFCYVRAPFHESLDDFSYEIEIEPKMSFGTGHHQTTQMMIQLMQGMEMQGKTVLDMGSGTGILAILAKKMGASVVEAIDIEDWAFENMKENFDRNKVEVNPTLGDVEELGKLNRTYDLIMANINKNILLQDMSTYDKFLRPGGFLTLSGFFITDQEELLEHPSLKTFELLNVLEKDNWCALKLKKPN